MVTFTAIATDAAGNASSTSTPLVVTVDNIAAAAPTIALATDSGRSGTDKITNSGLVNVGGLEANATWQYSLNNGTTWTAGSGTSFTLSGNGAKNVIVRQTDRAGNISANSAPLAFTLDTTAAAAPTIALAFDTGTSGTDKITNQGTLNISGLEANAIWQYSINNGFIWINGSSSNSLTLTGDGIKSVLVKQTDVAGNTSANSAPLAFTLDKTAPTAPVVSGYSLTNAISSIQGTTEPGATILFSTSASNPASFATPIGIADSNGNYTINTTDLAGAAAGQTYYLYAQDVAGNVGAASSQRVIVGDSANNTFNGVGTAVSDLLIGNAGTDTAQYAVVSNAISLTGSITATNVTSKNINIRTANIDVLTGIEQLSFTGTSYTGIGPGTNQLRSAVNSTTLVNNSISALAGAYDATTGAFSIGAANPNATLIAFDANSGSGTNYESFLVLDNVSISGFLMTSGPVGTNLTVNWNPNPVV